MKKKKKSYEITEDEGLTLFMPTQSDRTTNGVRIQVRTVFVPKLSNLQENENANKFHFSYKIWFLSSFFNYP